MSETIGQTADPPPTARSIVLVLRAHEAELRALGVERLALIGSMARGDQRADSDIDVLVRLNATDPSGYAFFGRLANLRDRLSELLGCHVDIVTEPVRKPRLRQSIEAAQIRAF